MDSLPVESEDHFITLCADQEEDPLESNGQRQEMWDLWDRIDGEYGDHVLVLVPGWFSEKVFDIHRPILLAEVEHDDPDSGAVLFGNTKMVDISVVTNEVSGELPIEQTFDDVDISDDDEYIDEAGLVWVPRSVKVAFRKA